MNVSRPRRFSGRLTLVKRMGGCVAEGTLRRGSARRHKPTKFLRGCVVTFRERMRDRSSSMDKSSLGVVGLVTEPAKPHDGETDSDSEEARSLRRMNRRRSKSVEEGEFVVLCAEGALGTDKAGDVRIMSDGYG